MDDLQFEPGIVAHVLRVGRKARGWTLKEVSRRSGIGYEALWRVETGRTKDPQVSTVIAIAKAFGLGKRFVKLLDFSKPW